MDLVVEHGVKRLPVLEDLKVVEIVTLPDVALRLDDVRSEAIELAERKSRWA